ncbi:isoprenylcysteine carboxylmethyltransferase family protein [Bradyrhizobium sp. U87765 SZCCT0131]|nr:isoprenylcysteine carboxylmethyltransferase family protein [Bradyrhizobium sp. U87765 SZCCT0131]MBR1261948.1 isoprenylcysteine carboxylmethyltransferase family protein [Bradyrhizobium sp. U87765 SZCCT0134]MBR1306199.1 isoprenylcysteine carboxylmethyltransferase family protein [Bradyrhizobium sp. U87765 SZCCT0110]MBR1317730.1 isoprenylcysteine carboxylmethyltransferase family protein [Bradyrhizobium sp. U87765 SZCCT0109]MBR1351432.1 isoprenylcysteine carboxylmethyltransferase family protein [
MIGRIIVQTVVWFGAMGALLFAGAGTVRWPAAWVFMVGMCAFGVWRGIVMVRRDPALVAERTRSMMQPGQPRADKIFVVVLCCMMMAWLVVMGVDVMRVQWSHMPLWLQAAGGALLFAGGWLADRVMRENSFAAAVVKIQSERRQTVISSGPYAVVRHPMYSGMVFVFLGIALLLGSWWGAVIAIVLSLMFCIRIAIEEKALREGLAGYGDYAVRVPWRLIPHVW